MLDILSPLAKATRVSRSIYDPATFVAVPGVWGRIRSDGSIELVPAGSEPSVPKLIINSASQNIYESQDVEVGRITTLESPGIRCKVSDVGFTGSISQSDDLVVSSVHPNEGKLIKLPTAGNGTYVIVARAEQVNGSEQWLIFETVSPRTVIVGSGSTTTTAEPTTTAAPTTTTVGP
jgi:hypothetical protein